MQGISTSFDQAPLDDGRDPRRLFLQIGPGIVAAAALAGYLGAWALHMRPTAAPDFGTRPAPIASAAPSRPAIPAAVVAAASPGQQIAAARSNPYGALVDLNPYGALAVDRDLFAAAGPPVAAPGEAQLQASVEAVPYPPAAPQEAAAPPPRRDVGEAEESAPLPPRRPAEFAALPPPPAPNRPVAPPNDKPASPSAPADNRNIFEKLFGGAQPAVAVAPPPGRGGGNSGFLSGLFNPAPSALTGFDKYTAVYDISARTVYLPDGTRLEAHSGLGDRLDDPRFVSERMRGATPPHLYELEPREALFHGVPALRLIPVGGGDLFGRAGLLAHSYMLGPNGQSNGCVSFKNYDAFLRAYQNGQIKRLAVVARLNG